MHSPLLSKVQDDSTNERQFSEDEVINDEPQRMVSRDFDRATSDFTTLMHLFKANFGTGLLGLPVAVAHAGVLVGPLGLVILAVITVHCMHLLATCSNVWGERRGLYGYASYGDIGERCFDVRYPGKGHRGRLLVHIFLTFTQIGFCCVYVVFVAKNLQQVLDSVSTFHIDVKIWILIILPYFVAFSFIQDLKSLSWISSIANFFLISGCVCILYFIFKNVKNPADFPLFAGWEKLPLFFGVAVYAFEGIGVIIPVKNAMRNPSHFRWLLNVAMVALTLLYVTIGFFGYLTCGDDCKGSITLNIGNTWLAIVVKCMFTLGIFFTYFLQFYVPLDFLEPWFLEKTKQCTSSEVLVRRFFFRTVIVTFTAAMGIIVPQLANIISLVGSISSSALALVFPPILHSISVPESSRAIHIKNIAISIFGILGGVFGTVFTIIQLVKDY